MRFLNLWAEKEWNIPLTAKILFFLLRVHHNQIVVSKTLRPMLDSVRVNLRRALRRQKDELGYNLAAARFVIRGINENSTAEFVGDGAEGEGGWEQISGKGGKKRGFANLS